MNNKVMNFMRGVDYEDPRRPAACPGLPRATGRRNVAIIITIMRMRRGTFGRRRLRLILTGVVISLGVLGLAPAGASSANISHSYRSADRIKNGSIVSLDPKRSDFVVPANTGNATQLLGVAVASDDSLIAVDADSGNVQVATTGTASVLVSTLGGDIRVGDQVAVSPFNGVGMKAVAGSKVVGLAQTAFGGATEGAATESVRDKDGRSRAVKVGYLRVNVAVGASTNGTSENLNSLQKIVQGLTGRAVPTIRIIISLAVAVIALLALITLVYASIYGSIISIGRNPLAKYAVFRALGSVVGLAILTALVAAVTIFFLLR